MSSQFLEILEKTLVRKYWREHKAKQCQDRPKVFPPTGLATQRYIEKFCHENNLKK